MNRPKPQFKAHLVFTFAEHGAGRRRSFGFEETGHRRVPMCMDGVEGLNTVGMWIGGAATFVEGDEIEVDCCVIWPEGFRNIVQPGVKFRLWDSGFFADGVVTDRCEEGWFV